ncbi:hypothetical protein TNCV_4493801 [Trichonephila clavipes]|nr:hypothetical protein TNCV_4493801 [Trichonephila clavipes]
MATIEAVHSTAMPEWMATTCSNGLDSLNTRLRTSSVGTERLGVKWSRNQVRVLDKGINWLGPRATGLEGALSSFRFSLNEIMIRIILMCGNKCYSKT